MGAKSRSTKRVDASRFLQYEAEEIAVWDGGVQTAFERVDRAPWVLERVAREVDRNVTEAVLTTNDASVLTALRALDGVADLDQFPVAQPGRSLFVCKNSEAALVAMEVRVPTPRAKGHEGATRLLKSLRVRVVGINFSVWLDHPHWPHLRKIGEQMGSGVRP